MMDTADSRIHNLAAWARRLIEAQEQKIGALLAENEKLRSLAAGTGESNTVADPFSSWPRQLGKDVMVRFGGQNATDECFDVEMRGEDLYILVNGSTAETAVIPQSNNTIRVRKLPRRPRPS